MTDNTNFHRARRKKNDEFYTQLSDIQNELKYYLPHFKDKIVYSNCDNESSNFVKYFNQRNDIKEFIHTSTNYRNMDNMDRLVSSDIICTNPPFSLFREYLTTLMEYDKKFLIIGNVGSITYKEMFPFLKNNRLWLGVEKRMKFINSDGVLAPMGMSCWFTNMMHNIVNPFMELTMTYNEKDYPKYDNYNAINVDRIKNIPIDYDGEMGVPYSILLNYNPKQFEIIDIDYELPKTKIMDKKTDKFYLNGKRQYTRIVVKRKE